MPRVAITGLGAVSALGPDAPTLWSSVVDGKSGIAPIANIPAERLTVRIAAEVKGFDPAQHFEMRRLAMVDRASQFALVAAREALKDAGLSFKRKDAARAGAILGGTSGWVTVDECYDQFYGQQVNRLPPFTIPRIMANAPASLITIEHGIRGPSFAVSSACASANHAVGIAFQMIRSGSLDVAVTGGSDASIVPGFLKGWDALRILSPDTCRPFSRNRSGLVIGEGAGVLVLEDLERASARGAHIYGEIIGFGMNADGRDLTAPDEASAADAMTQALDDAGLAPDAV
ncbi:MAG: beta-ketoacyl-[acyl-carrier-protein] synthase family protein, partial [Roseiarcus sp.]